MALEVSVTGQSGPTRAEKRAEERSGSIPRTIINRELSWLEFNETGAGRGA